MSTVPTSSTAASIANEERAAQELLGRLRAATIGTYDIHSELGRGGMATVYLAHDISLNRKVAIKVMSPAMVHGAGMVERFKREARTAAALSHPNIIPIYAVHEADGLLFCVMKVVEGTPLDAVMRELGKLPVAMVQGILAQVGGALGYAHRHGVIHRDIKPGNILIDDEGWAVVTDFGIAKVVENTEGLTVTGMAIGTPTYMSPEQATADDITGASDQYSLGVVAYEMLTGRPPFTGTSMMALMYSHFHDEPPSIRLFRDDCPDELCDAVMKMLRKTPAERFPSMEEAVAAAGARPLTHDDPSRSQLIALARTGLTHRIVSQAKTPRSPIPRAPRGAAARIRRNPALLGATGAALVAVGFVGAQLLTNPGPPAAQPTAETTAPTQVVAESVSLVVPPPAPPGANGGAPRPSAPAPVSSQRRVEPAPERRTPNTVAGAGAPAADTNRPAVSPGTESSGTSGLLKGESTRTPPPIEPPPVTTAAPVTQPAATVSKPVPTAAEQVTAVITAYAQALAASDMATARRIYQGMPNDQREGLEALWKEGGTMTPSWTVTDIVVNGDAATARVRGTNAVTSRRGPSSTVPVSLRARLERRNGEWRLVALIN